MKDRLALHRAYFVIVLGFTLWVGYFGFFRPDEILRALPWPVPPLHARFIGALYLSASAFLLASALAGSAAQVRVIVIIALVWTGWLLVVSVIHWNSFDFGRVQVWYWAVAYVTFPVAAAWLAWTGPARSRPEGPRDRPAWVGVFFALQGGLFVALAAACFFAPAFVVSVWPWKISPFLAQVYSGPLLGYGVGGLVLARRGQWPGNWIPSMGLACFAMLALVASALHRGLFVMGSLSSIAWFATLAVLALAGTVITLKAFRHD